MHADIRPARVSDIDTLVSIENGVFDTDRISRRAFLSHIGSGSASLLVADRDGAIAGYALLLFRKGGRTARLYSIAVAVGHASAGIGRRLLAAAEEAALARGCPILRLEVREDNARAIGLYRRSGFRPIGRRENYYEDGAPALRFEKHLGGSKEQ
ncbi:GNAT family N-acetyltransferase [Chelativorans sp. AA-79]|uniref:GNAT family N-acetyltransferase n=1 Tax=Chelativorans sp. AA-79 TaxID=3028735 RepID=UPI0023F85129|nr:GNAT family N-acetyltransferase [Chelativorans sp. AA-79]WEX07665.1 GNAT family N-acetyltransferase [Chelativorans sp. AA-79]